MKKKDILIVDDDRELAEITRDMLEDYGYQTEIAESTDAAYEFLTDCRFRLILLDINLPGESGFEFCKELRKNSILPIIFVSARTSENDRITGLDLGADDYLPKPYSLQELLSRINANLRRAYGFQEKEPIYRIGKLTVDCSSRMVTACSRCYSPGWCPVRSGGFLRRA